MTGIGPSRRFGFDPLNGRYWRNSGNWAERALRALVEIDPYATCTAQIAALQNSLREYFVPSNSLAVIAGIEGQVWRGPRPPGRQCNLIGRARHLPGIPRSAGEVKCNVCAVENLWRS